VKAVQLVACGAPGQLKYTEIPDPSPGAGEVLLRVRACGLNRLDLWLEEGALPIPVQLPRIPGGEISGEVLEAGSGVADWRRGDRVAAQSNLFCGHCEFCLQGRESLCLNGQLLGVQRDGGFAERVVVPASALVRLPANVEFVASAALTLAGSTAMHMLTQRASIEAGDWVLVMGGASGVGSAGVQIAGQLGARVITTGSTQAKREFGLGLGAVRAVDSSKPDWPAEVREITGKRGVDLVLEHMGGEVLAQCFNCLARGGRIVTCGATAGRKTPLNLWPFFVKEQELTGSYGRSRKDIEAVLEWAAEGKIKPAIWQVFPLEETPAAFAALRGRQAMGKIVVESR
jgi:NADPH:quinone reductase-like Zn-dependent oxidoreductase